MPYPAKPAAIYDYVNYQASEPTLPLPAAQVAADLEHVNAAIDDTIDFLKVSLRSDNKIQPFMVPASALDRDARALIVSGGNIRGEWVTATSYAPGDVVASGDATYIAAVAHTSDSFNADITAGKWLILASPYTPGGSAVVAVDTMAALEALQTRPLAVCVKGFNAAGDGGGGTFRWDSGSTTPAVAGMVVAPALGPAGRYKRVYEPGELNVCWFGAKGDGAADDVAAIQAAIDYAGANGLGTVFIPARRFNISTTLRREHAVRLVGEGQLADTTGDSGTSAGAFNGSQLYWTGGAADMIRTKSLVPNSRLWGADIVNLFLDGANVATAGARESSVVLSKYTLSTRRFTYAGLVLDDDNGVLTYFNEVRLQHIYGSAAGVEGAHGVVFDGSKSDKGVTQNTIYWTKGLIKNGDMVHLRDADGNVIVSAQAAKVSGGTGKTIRFANGNPSGRPARNNQVGVKWTGDIHCESQTYGNVIERAHSEGGGITLDAGAHVHFKALDFQTGEMWQTHRYAMSDELMVPANAMQTEVAMLGFVAYDPPSLADGAGTSTTVTVAGALLGDLATASFSLDTQGVTIDAQVTSANTVTVRFQNESGGTVDLASGTLRVRVDAHPTRTAVPSELFDLWSSVAMADAITTTLRFNVTAPYHWNAGRIVGLKLYHAQSATNATKQVHLRVRALTAGAGVSTSTPEVDETRDIVVNDAIGRHTVSTITFSSPLAFAKGDYAAFRIDRQGADANDTASGNLHVLGAAVIYEATGPASPGSGGHAVPPPVRP